MLRFRQSRLALTSHQGYFQTTLSKSQDVGPKKLSKQSTIGHEIAPGPQGGTKGKTSRVVWGSSPRTDIRSQMSCVLTSAGAQCTKLAPTPYSNFWLLSQESSSASLRYFTPCISAGQATSSSPGRNDRNSSIMLYTIITYIDRVIYVTLP